jgi:hypothetical protein
VQQPPIKKDTTTIKLPVQKATDTLVKKPTPKPSSVYTYSPDAVHYAVVVLDKVDVVFGNEAKNAFFRFNREKYYNQPLESQLLPLTTDIKLLLVGNFITAQAAIDYAQRAKALAASEIIPWLTGNKYTFSIISASNLEILKTATDINAYKKFLEFYLPGKF